MYAFLKCGMLGWCIELFWTGMHSLIVGNGKLTGYSSLWMFPIYGMAAAINPLYQIIKPLNIVFRGLIYMICIFLVEYITGSILMMTGRCPWDYSECRFQVHGVIRLDYAPMWFTVGLFFEWVLRR
ncbi:MAG: hypothetical protein PHE06_13630 [Lachnospiraceae bacterium]|nr:hypothetical protein [Lachnospiraceae bacterium]MDD3796977.1 hypothetical protein [Lachnospiraceae bacterium]